MNSALKHPPKGPRLHHLPVAQEAPTKMTRWQIAKHSTATLVLLMVIVTCIIIAVINLTPSHH